MNYESDFISMIKVTIKVKPHSCSECDFQCNDAHIFNDHTKGHSEKEPIARSVIKNKESPITDENVIKCPECIFNCPSKDEMVIHLKTHNIHACDKCNYRSNSTNGLKGHMKKHYDKK